MKRIFLILTLSSIIFSCHKEQKKEEKALGLGNSIWVNAKYLETLERTKSPLQAKVFADTVMLSFNLKADTANVVWNFHEGSAFLVKQGNNIQFFNAYEEKKSPEMEGNLQNGLFKINQTSFKKVDTTGFIEKKFWIGKYSTSRGNIDLKFDGKVTGVDSLESYYVWCDYVTTQTDIDLVDFFDKNNKSTTYGYKFAGKEIIFYEFIWSEEGLIGKAGKELFRLKRI